ncbi:MAG: ABC transporter ATP-binding protein [Actinomycetota bacterium]|nr:ABC transporter ATP-binding protein [Actinomycetota bacterium]
MSIWASVRASLALLAPRDRRRVYLVVIVQSLLALLDLVAVALIGILALLAAGAGDNQVPPQVDSILSAFGVGDVEPYTLAVSIAVIAGLLMVSKSIISYTITRRVFVFLARRQAQISSSLASRMLTRPLLDVQSRSSQDIAVALTLGVNSLTMGVIGQGTIFVTEVATLTVLAAGLMLIDPMVTVFTFVFFALVGFGLHRALAGWASRLGGTAVSTQSASIASVQELMRTYREISVAGRRGVYVDEFHRLRSSYAGTQASLQIMGQLSKYVFEIALILGGGLLAISQFLTRDVEAAVAIIAVFLAAAMRIMPSLLRMQSAGLRIRTESGYATPALALARELDETEGSVDAATAALSSDVTERLVLGFTEGFADFDASVRMRDVTLTYPGADAPAIDAVSLTVPSATSLALVGATGTGKSTLADVMLGVVRPDAGSIEISGVEPTEAVMRWPGAIAYVPQDSAIVTGTVRRNVALGLPVQMIDDDRVWEALERAHLADFLHGQRDGLDTVVGEEGVRLSGGQRQRLGIARALYTRPHLLVLDEATSALDAETEDAVARTLAELSGNVTLVVIAHRLATVRHSDQVAFLDDGRLVALGSFEEVREQAPAFDRQAQMLGL